MIILGINSGWHDSSAAIIEDGKILHLIETDRVSRVKQAMKQDPSLSVVACLNEAGMTVDDIDILAVGWDENILDKMYNTGLSIDDHRDRHLPPKLLPRKRNPEVVFVPHHFAHAASGMYTSGFDRSAVLVVDGRGECQSTSIMIGSQEGLELVREWPIAESLGNYYGYAAEWSGFGFWSPGKLMGLAPYGRSTGNTIISVGPDGYHFVDGKPADPDDIDRQEREHIELLKAWYKSQYPFAEGNPGDIMAHANFAATVQSAFEEAMYRLVEMALEAANCPNLVIAGGSGQNCTFNGALSRSGVVSEVYVPPVTHDAGVGLGAALYVDNQRRKSKTTNPRLPHAYFGHTPSEESIERAVARSGFPCRRLDDSELLPLVASRLASGDIVGWFHGTAEIGQRALGGRSMLCDPRDRNNLRRVNEAKGREIWRPLAPSVLEEYVHEFFDGPHPYIAQFMLAALPVRKEAWHRIPATVHVDGSARPQWVRKDTNPRYWTLIDEFRKLTGVPVVMNTSFNLASEPIVHTPEDAIRSFARSDMAILVLGNHFIEKPIR